MKLAPFAVGALSLPLLFAAPTRADEPTFAQDAIIVQRVTSSKSPGETRVEILLSGNMLKMRKQGPAEQTEVIVDFASKKIWDLSEKTKQYRETTFEALERHFEQSFQGFRKLPATEQNQLRAWVQALPPTVIDRTDEFATLAGFKARKYEVTIFDQKQEVWASPDFKLPDAYYLVLELRHPLLGPRGEAVRERMRQLRQIDGFFLKQVVHAGRPEERYTETTETVEVRRGIKIPAGEFEIPKGFSKETPPAKATTATAVSLTLPGR